MHQKFSVLIKEKINKFNKTLRIPSDKSCSIRALVFASQCIGESKIANLLESEDVLDCVRALKNLGVKIVKKKNSHIWGNGLGSFRANNKTKIWMGNSGTLCRIICGLLATQSGKFYLYGDQSLSKRDMSRIIAPLEKLGAFFYPKGKKKLPLTIQGTTMPMAQNHIQKLPSAQVKSSLLAAFLNTPGRSSIEEKKKLVSRTHTEILLKKISANIKIKKSKKGNLISVTGQKNLYAFNYTVHSDPSSAAFLIALTLLTPGAKSTITSVICNETRIKYIRVLKKMNGNIKIKNLKRDSSSGELIGTIVTYGSNLKPITISKDIGTVIDELPILFVVASLTKGISKFKSISELAHKESSRAVEMKKILVQAGIRCKNARNEMTIYGKNKIGIQNKSIVVKTKGDHRICMSALILSLVTGIKTKINNFETVNTSFPGFISLIKKNLGAKIEIKKN